MQQILNMQVNLIKEILRYFPSLFFLFYTSSFFCKTNLSYFFIVVIRLTTKLHLFSPVFPLITCMNHHMSLWLVVDVLPMICEILIFLQFSLVHKNEINEVHAEIIVLQVLDDLLIREWLSIIDSTCCYLLPRLNMSFREGYHTMMNSSIHSISITDCTSATRSHLWIRSIFLICDRFLCASFPFMLSLWCYNYCGWYFLICFVRDLICIIPLNSSNSSNSC